MFQPGERIAERFEVEALLGEGGLAQVYRVRHTTLGTTHALKLLTMSHQSLVERLLQEGRIQAQLRHPNIIGVSDVITVRGMPGLLLEYVDCETLEASLARRGRMPLEEALDLFAAVLSGVATAHQAGVLHRDLKPANILLARTPGGVVPKVSDFGIAKIAAGDSNPGLTRAGSAMGTPGYVAPEQMEDASNVDLRADIFSLGTILYELVTGKRAFPSKSMRETLNAAASGNYTPPEQHDPALPEPVLRTVRRAMAPEPKDRFQDCFAFAESLFVDQPGRLALVRERQLAPAPAPGTLWGRTGTWTPTPGTRGGDSGTWAEGSRSSETLAPHTDIAPPPHRRRFLAAAPPAARWMLIIGALGLGAVALLSIGLLIGRLLRAEATGEVAQPEPPEQTTADPGSSEPTPAQPSTAPANAPTATPPEGEGTAPPTPAPPTSAATKPSSTAKTAGSSAAASPSAATEEPAAEESTAEPQPAAEEPTAEPQPAAEEPEVRAPAEVTHIVGTWAGDPWRITILDQQGTQVGGYIYRGTTGTRIEVEGTYDPATGVLTLVDQGPARWRLTGTIEGRWWKGTYTQGQGEIATPFSARRTR